MGHDPIAGRAARKSRAKRKARAYAARDREICRIRKRDKLPHSELAKKYGLTESRISQILKAGGLIGIRAPYKKPEKPKPPHPAPKKPKNDKELARENAWIDRWARHIPFLNPLNESQES